MSMNIKATSFLAIAVLSTAAFAAVQGLSVKRTPKEGTTQKYTMSGDIDFGGMPITIKANAEEKVTKVNADGSYVVTDSQTDGSISINGQDQDIPPETTTKTIAADGRLLSVEGSPDESSAMRMGYLDSVFDAGKPLNVGDKWTVEIKENSAKHIVAGKADFEILGEEKVGGVDTIKISDKYSESGGSDAASSVATIWIDKADGSLVKSVSEWKNAPVPGAPGPINATITMTRV